jgi:hypothetical protein
VVPKEEDTPIYTLFLGGGFRNLKIQTGESLLIRGRTASVGLAAASIAEIQALAILAATRRAE